MPFPTLIKDYEVIGGGSNIALSSWGKLRGAISDYHYSDLYVSDFSLEYKKGFITTAGNGLIRTEFAWGPSLFTIPNFEGFDYSFAPDGTLNFASHYLGSTSGTICDDDRAQLIGESVNLTLYSSGTSSTASLTIAHNAFDDPPKYQEFAGYSNDGAPKINSIGKLTAF